MGVGAEHGRHAAVEMPAHRDLLARRLGVHVDEDVVRRAGQLGDQRVGLGEGGAPRRHEHVARQVDHRQAHAVAGDDRVAVAGLGAQVVGGPQDPRLVVEVGVDLAMAVGVVAERDHIDAGREQLVGDLRRDPEPAGDVLAVDDDERRVVALAQQRQHAQQRPATGRADQVAAEKDSRRGGHAREPIGPPRNVPPRPPPARAREKQQADRATGHTARDEHRAAARRPRSRISPPRSCRRRPRRRWSIPRGVQLVLLLVGLLGLWVAARAARSVVEIIIVASFIALMLNPFVAFLGRRGIPRGMAIPLAYISLLLVLAGIGLALAQPITNQVNAFQRNVPAARARGQQDASTTSRPSSTTTGSTSSSRSRARRRSTRSRARC